ncbi:MAG: hypothetical protein R6W06_06135 [Prochlorococcaceae cyanobacterium]
MEDLLQNALDTALDTASADPGLGPPTTANALIFLLISALGLLMALVYVPIRLFLTLTARSRRLRLLLRIRSLREELGRPVSNA